MPFANLEARILLAQILQRYIPKTVPGFAVVPQPIITLFPKFGLQMTLEPATPVHANQPA
jgi:hypothetical protein